MTPKLILLMPLLTSLVWVSSGCALEDDGAEFNAEKSEQPDVEAAISTHKITTDETVNRDFNCTSRACDVELTYQLTDVIGGTVAGTKALVVQVDKNEVADLAYGFGNADVVGGTSWTTSYEAVGPGAHVVRATLVDLQNANMQISIKLSDSAAIDRRVCDLAGLMTCPGILVCSSSSGTGKCIVR